MDKHLISEAKRALSLAGWQIVDKPVWSGPERSFLARRSQFGRVWTAPVVCVGLENADLDSLLEELEGHFAAQLESREFGEVLVVVDEAEARDLDPDVLGHRLPCFIVRTPDQLLRESIDFGSYLNSLATIFDDSSDGLASYYVRPLDSMGMDIEEEITRWIDAPETIADKAPPYLDPTQPVAVLGAYGIGKSSLATRLASQLAQAALENQDCRIPVLIRLGEVSGEQTLEGLLGKHFTATHQVNGYSFAAFEALNQRGHLVVILDGFDEMKQLLSWREFRYNLSQLNRLQTGAARLIILGRPTAFENDAEYQVALHGRRYVNNRYLPEPGWPDYQELEVASLDVDKIMVFAENYLKYRKSPLVSDDRSMRQLREQLQSRQLKDIARRPVQLRMLVDILPDYRGNIEDLNVGQVYKLFIELLIQEVMVREQAKHARLRFTADARRDFLKRFAYWLWNTRDAGIVTTDMIPEGLITPFAGQDPELESVRRDLVAGSPLDRRHGERIRFPHRSFQEFLVAETIWERLKSGDLTLGEADSMINPEVAEFMALQRGPSEETLAQRLLPTLNVPIRQHTCNAVFLSDQAVSGLHERVLENGQNQPLTDAELLMIALWTLRHPSSEMSVRPEDLLKVKGPSPLYRLVCSLLINGKSRRHDPLIVELLGKIATQVSPVERITAQRVRRKDSIVMLNRNWVAKPDRGGVNIGKISGKARIAIIRGKQEIEGGGDNLGVMWMTDLALSFYQKSSIVKSGAVIDIRSMRPKFAQILSQGPFVTDWIRNNNIDPTVMQRDEFDLLPDASLRETIKELDSVVSQVNRFAGTGRLASATLYGILPVGSHRAPERDD
ncbi:NACHT domain-containing protein [Streptomyces sp. NPDC002928]|uniref:NACHT domain-containing protein n=1 Tax=Streptomyces sp. NPDC002928 TaxID=3154440 RepID=UPI0033BD58D4